MTRTFAALAFALSTFFCGCARSDDPISEDTETFEDEPDDDTDDDTRVGEPASDGLGPIFEVGFGDGIADVRDLDVSPPPPTHGDVPARLPGIGFAADAPACPDPLADGVSYVSDDPVECATISVLCLPGYEPIDAACGSGCEPGPGPTQR